MVFLYRSQLSVSPERWVPILFQFDGHRKRAKVMTTSSSLEELVFIAQFNNTGFEPISW